MMELDDIITSARHWLARGKRSNAPTLYEALRNGPLDEDVLLDAHAECSETEDESGLLLIEHLLLLSDEDRELISAHLSSGGP